MIFCKNIRTIPAAIPDNKLLLQIAVYVSLKNLRNVSISHHPPFLARVSI
nr:MAG TPA: hypothetical protein [Caudoviricetes sp.]DAV96493.1 MAG TPA: hypothetical protein [Caudoviricetes sp.]DAX07151.1 MAG TPA: hypothetical protein [Bacteriophage sp.]